MSSTCNTNECVHSKESRYSSVLIQFYHPLADNLEEAKRQLLQSTKVTLLSVYSRWFTKSYSCPPSTLGPANPRGGPCPHQSPACPHALCTVSCLKSKGDSWDFVKSAIHIWHNLTVQQEISQSCLALDWDRSHASSGGSALSLLLCQNIQDVILHTWYKDIQIEKVKHEREILP